MTTNQNRPAVTVRDLRKSYGGKVVLDGVDLSVAEGTVLALLGPNGAGKTTMVKILSTLSGADGGDVRVYGHDPAREPDAVRAVIGVTGQFSAVDRLLTGGENLLLMANLHRLGRREGRRRAGDLLERFGLAEAAGTPAAIYSGGMRRRLDLAMTLVGSPRVIFLDEPTTGLDPRSRRDLWRIIRDLVADGVTVLLTTQYLEEADQLADRIALLDRGRLVAEGTPDGLKRRIPGGHVSLRFAAPAERELAARTLRAAGLDGTTGRAGTAGPDGAPDPAGTAGPPPGRDGPERDAQAPVLRVPHDGTVHSLRALLARLDDASVEVQELTVHTPDLDDVFLALTGGHNPTDNDDPALEAVR